MNITTWKTLGGAVIFGNIIDLYFTQSISTTLLAILIWFGAFLCIEDKLGELPDQASLIGLASGLAMLVFSLWRTSQVFHPDAVVYGLSFIQGLGLVLLITPFRRLWAFKESLAVLAMQPVALVVHQIIPIELLSKVTARLTQVLLLSFAQNPQVTGAEVLLAGGGVKIAGSCSGSETLMHLMLIACIFVLAFPIPSKRYRWLMIPVAVLLAIVGNAFRIALLALITASDLGAKDALFKFFHEEYGSLVFSGITVSLFAWAYITVLDSELKKREQAYA